MIRKIATTAATAAALTLGVGAAAAGAGGYYAYGSVSIDGKAGPVSADYDSDAFGNLEADSSATGGKKSSGLFGGSNGTSAASATAAVSDGFALQPGNYRITVTYADVTTTESVVGSGVADADLTASATLATGYFEPTYLGRAETDVSGTPGTVSLSFDISVTSYSQVGVQAMLEANSQASGKGSTATTVAETGAVTFTATPIG